MWSAWIDMGIPAGEAHLIVSKLVGGEGFLLYCPLINLGRDCRGGCTHIHVEGRPWIAKGWGHCFPGVSWGLMQQRHVQSCGSFWLGCWAEEFALWVLLLELLAKWDPQSDNQRAGGTCKSTVMERQTGSITWSYLPPEKRCWLQSWILAELIAPRWTKGTALEARVKKEEWGEA